MKHINLTQDKYTIVDDEDYEYLNQWKWCINSNGYAIRSEKGKHILMHKVIINDKSNVDHINGDRLDNRRNNLRLATHKENMRNKNKINNTSSKYKGVTYNKRAKKWKSQITIDKNCIYLGLFENEVDAAKAYNIKAIELFGDFAKLNCI